VLKHLVYIWSGKVLFHFMWLKFYLDFMRLLTQTMLHSFLGSRDLPKKWILFCTIIFFFISGYSPIVFGSVIWLEVSELQSQIVQLLCSNMPNRMSIWASLSTQGGESVICWFILYFSHAKGLFVMLKVVTLQNSALLIMWLSMSSDLLGDGLTTLRIGRYTLAVGQWRTLSCRTCWNAPLN